MVLETRLKNLKCVMQTNKSVRNFQHRNNINANCYTNNPVIIYCISTFLTS